MKPGIRLTRLKAVLENRGLEAMVISSCANISYLTSYPSRDSYFLVTNKENFYLTDFRYLEEAHKHLKGLANILPVGQSVFRTIADTCLALNLKRIGFEERVMPFAEYSKIRQYLGKKISLVPTSGLTEELRKYKDGEEIAAIKHALKITAQALSFSSKLLKPGLTELTVAGELERFIRDRGATKSAFDIIVASGCNSSCSHHITSKRKIKSNEPVLIDIGVEYQGYKSDLTRVFFLGKINSLGKNIYNIVIEAQNKAFERIQPGIKASEIDAAARQYIAKKGYGPNFGHSLGHGVGLEVHEDPHISAKNDNIIAESMVFTVEPAIYLAGKFGIRIEDMVLVTKEKCEVLSGFIDKRN
jgi:Xaa-Pro aminopeptidase